MRGAKKHRGAFNPPRNPGQTHVGLRTAREDAAGPAVGSQTRSWVCCANALGRTRSIPPGLVAPHGTAQEAQLVPLGDLGVEGWASPGDELTSAINSLVVRAAARASRPSLWR